MAMCVTATTIFTGGAGAGITAFAQEGESQSGNAATEESDKDSKGTEKAQSESDGEDAQELMTVSVAAYDYTAVEAGLENASETGVILEEEVTVATGTSAAEVIGKAFENGDIAVEGLEYGYVSSINGLTDTDGGGYSGWCMAYNNDDYSNGGISKLTLKDGDSIRFDYTCNLDYSTDDIGNGWYGNPIINTMTIGDETVTMSRESSYDSNYNLVTKYYINGELTDSTGSEDDPFVLEFHMTAQDAKVADIAFTGSLNSHYTKAEGISLEGGVYDLSDGLEFSLASLGESHKSYFKINVINENIISNTYYNKLQNTLSYLRQAYTNPTVSSVGGEWAVLALARSGYEDSKWYGTYYKNVVSTVKAAAEANEEAGTTPVSTLSSSKSTENSRVIIGLTAIGADATDVAGYNLLEPLADLDYVSKQGLNGAIYALIALDSGNYEVPALPEGSEATQTTRDKLVEKVLDLEIGKDTEEAGGWSLYGAADPDITAMTIQALAPYYSERADVKAAVDRALSVLSNMQTETGGFKSWGSENSESCAQVVSALSSISLDADKDADFVKGINSVLDALLYYSIDEGGFAHAESSGKLSVNAMASEQAAYALVAYYRYKSGENTLYDMSDAKKLYVTDISGAEVQLSYASVAYDGTEKTPEVKVVLNGEVLTENEDYKVSYVDNVEPGTKASVVITGIKEYTGTINKTFEITTEETIDTPTKDPVKEPGDTPTKTELASTTIKTAKSSGLTVQLAWDKVTGAESYVINRKNLTTGKTETVATVKTASYTDKNVKGGVKYQYTITAKASDVSSTSKAVNVIVLSKTKLTLKNSSSGITLKWTKVANATKYKILRKDTLKGTWKTVATTAKLTYLDKKVKSGTRYAYVVKPLASNAVGGYTAKVIYRAGSTSVTSIKSSAKSKFTVTYKKAGTVTGYQIQYATNKSFKSANIKTVKGASKRTVTIKTAKKGVRYYVRVRSYKKVGNTSYYGAWSTIKSVVVKSK